MRIKLLLLTVFLCLFTACSQQADEDYLIGGNWIATAGFEDGEVSGEPNCNFFEKGLEFKEDQTVYNADWDEDFDYRLSDRNNITEITFLSDRAGVFSYNIHVISENEMALEGANLSEGKSCYLERK